MPLATNQMTSQGNINTVDMVIILTPPFAIPAVIPAMGDPVVAPVPSQFKVIHKGTPQNVQQDMQTHLKVTGIASMAASMAPPMQTMSTPPVVPVPTMVKTGMISGLGTIILGDRPCVNSTIGGTCANYSSPVGLPTTMYTAVSA